MSKLLKWTIISFISVILLTGCSSDEDAPPEPTPEQQADIDAMNEILSQVHKIIVAYDVSVELGILNQSATDLAVQFQDDHLVHSEMLAATIERLRGRPVRQKKPHEYAFPTRNLVLPQDVLKFLEKEEDKLLKRYVSANPISTQKESAAALASILAVVAQHQALLRYFLGERPIPQPFVK